jgi:CRISPR/Cas system-associated endonuclease Cas1
MTLEEVLNTVPKSHSWIIVDCDEFPKRRGFHGREKRRLLAKMQRMVDWSNEHRLRAVARENLQAGYAAGILAK